MQPVDGAARESQHGREDSDGGQHDEEHGSDDADGLAPQEGELQDEQSQQRQDDGGAGEHHGPAGSGERHSGCLPRFVPSARPWR